MTGWGQTLRRAVLGDEPADERLLERALADLDEELRAPVSWPEHVYGKPKSGVRRKGDMDLEWGTEAV